MGTVANKGITEFKFRSGLPLEFEIISSKDLYAKNKKILTSPHRSDFYHIIWIDKGSTSHLIDFKPVKLKSNSLLFINKGRVHFFDGEENFSGKIFLFTNNFFCRNSEDVRFLHNSILFHDFLETVPVKLDRLKPTFIQLLDLMEREFANGESTYKPELLQNYLHNLLFLADREKRKSGFQEIPKGADLDYSLLFKTLLEENFLSVKSVHTYADLIHISEKKLNQATTNVLGRSPKEIINERVLLEAKRLLVHTNTTIKAIGFQLGFEEPTNFIKYFRQQSGKTPSEFRESHL